jgi:TfoX/Sxy family transcriptional regulator of competence genes
MAKAPPPPEKIALFDQLLATHPAGIERKGKNMIYTSVNGHMFTYLDSDGVLGIRMSKEDQAAFVEKYKTGPYLQYGATMRGYVTVPDSLFQDTEALKPYLEQSYNYITSIEPKPTTKKKK